MHGRLVNFSEMEAFQDSISSITSVPKLNQVLQGHHLCKALEGSLAQEVGRTAGCRRREYPAFTSWPTAPTIFVPFT